MRLLKAFTRQAYVTCVALSLICGLQVVAIAEDRVEIATSALSEDAVQNYNSFKKHLATVKADTCDPKLTDLGAALLSTTVESKACKEALKAKVSGKNKVAIVVISCGAGLFSSSDVYDESKKQWKKFRECGNLEKSAKLFEKECKDARQVAFANKNTLACYDLTTGKPILFFDLDKDSLSIP